LYYALHRQSRGNFKNNKILYLEWAKEAVDLGFVLPVYIWDAVLWNNSNSIAFIAPTATRKWVDLHPKPTITYPETNFNIKCIFGDSATFTSIN
jgi:hypothetical protein